MYSHTFKILLLTSLVLLLLGVSPILVKPLFSSFVVNISESAPKGLYKLRPLNGLAREDLVQVKIPKEMTQFAKSRPWLSRYETLLKKVAALPGDEFCVSEDGVFVNGERKGPVFKTDSEGRALPRKRGCEIVNEGSIAVLSDFTPRSFDSRYFGVIQRGEILGEAELLLKFY